MGLEQKPAEAAQATFSLFGFGGGVSDAYQQIDADAISPYSQFSNPSDSIFATNPEIQQKILQRNQGRVAEYISELDQVPELIRTKQGEAIKRVIGQKTGMLRDAMEYVTRRGPQYETAPGGTTYKKKDAFQNVDAPGMKEADEFFQDISDLGVAARTANWAWATEAYDKSVNSFAMWKNVVGM